MCLTIVLLCLLQMYMYLEIVPTLLAEIVFENCHLSYCNRVGPFLLFYSLQNLYVAFSLVTLFSEVIKINRFIS